MIRLGEVGRKVLRLTAWMMVVGALVAAVFGEWIVALQLGLIAAACKGALIWEDRERADTGTEVEPPDAGG